MLPAGILATTPAVVTALRIAGLQAISCSAMRACHTHNCPVAIATQQPQRVARLVDDKSAQQLANCFRASVELMPLMARACGHDPVSKFELDDLSTWKREMAQLSGVSLGDIG